MSLLKDFSYKVKREVLGDASAALGVIHRRGMGRPRHVDTGLLWIQQTASETRLRDSTLLGTINPADLMTKYFMAGGNEGHCARLSAQFAPGRAKAAPTLSNLLEGEAMWEMASSGVHVVTNNVGDNDKYKADIEARFRHVQQPTVPQLQEDCTSTS